MHESLPAPSLIRWRVLLLLVLVTYTHHFNRVGLAVAADEHIMPEYGITATQMGVVYSAFLLFYTLCMTPGGWFIDRFGARASLLAMTVGMAGFVFLTGGIGLVVRSAGVAVTSLLIVRSLMGVFGAPMHPAAGQMVGNWFPLPQRAGGNGTVIAAAAVGIASTYYVMGTLMDHIGWPWAFTAVAGATALLAIAWGSLVTDLPFQHPAVNEAERRLIADGDRLAVASPGDAAAGRRSWTSLLKNRSLVLLTISYSAVGYFEYIFFYWMHYYFDEVLHLGKDRSRLYSTICLLAMAAGMAGGGLVCDFVQRVVGYRRGRAIVPVLGMLGSAALLYAGLRTTRPEAIVACFASALAMIGASEGPIFATAVHLGGRRGGLSGAITNTGGNIGGVVAPALTPWLSERYGWAAGLTVASVYCVLGAALWLWIDPQEGSEREPDPREET